jgi:hypothetical protein
MRLGQHLAVSEVDDAQLSLKQRKICGWQQRQKFVRRVHEIGLHCRKGGSPTGLSATDAR